MQLTLIYANLRNFELRKHGKIDEEERGADNPITNLKEGEQAV